MFSQPGSDHRLNVFKTKDPVHKKSPLRNSTGFSISDNYLIRSKDLSDQISSSCRITCFVIVPANYFNQFTIHFGQVTVKDI